MLTRTTAFVAAAALLAGTGAAHAQATTDWVEGHNSKTRLVSGSAARPGAPAKTYAGVEIVMADGWKTYWRNPGDAGGVPPHFDWAGSENLAAAKVQFPAPTRLKDASGDSVGYKKAVVLPIEVTPVDPAKPVTLKLALEFGVCREICIPAEASLALTVPPSPQPMPASLATALDLVPRKSANRRPNDPEVKATRANLAGDKPKLEIDAAFPGDGASADVFVEAPDGIYLSLPTKTSTGTGGVQTFTVDLATGVDTAELKGKTLLITLVSSAGQSEATWKLD